MAITRDEQIEIHIKKAAMRIVAELPDDPEEAQKILLEALRLIPQK